MADLAVARAAMANCDRGRRLSGELLADQLAHDRPVGAAGHLRHHVGHDATEVAHARRTDLGDRAVDNLLQLVLFELLRHELLQDEQLRLLGLGLLGPLAGAKRLGRLDSSLSLALEDLKLLVVVERALELLLRAPEARKQQPQRIAPIVLARPHRLAQLVLESLDQAHAGIPLTWPPRTCQCRWKIVCPAPSPTFTSTR